MTTTNANNNYLEVKEYNEEVKEEDMKDIQGLRTMDITGVLNEASTNQINNQINNLNKEISFLKTKINELKQRLDTHQVAFGTCVVLVGTVVMEAKDDYLTDDYLSDAEKTVLGTEYSTDDYLSDAETVLGTVEEGYLTDDDNN